MNGNMVTTAELAAAVERSEILYMNDRMQALAERPGNPEGAEIKVFGSAVCYYAATMPWPSFNTVKGLHDAEADRLDEMLDWYRQRGRSPRIEAVPALTGEPIFRLLAERGFRQSGFHVSMAADLREDASDLHHRRYEDKDQPITIRRLDPEEMELYATIHCRGTGLGDGGIVPVAANNRVLAERDGWSFYLASWEGDPAAVGVMHRLGPIASLTFAATLPAFRGRGLQQRLIQERLHAARQAGCQLLVGQCAYASASQRNMERAGLRIAYVRSEWTAQPPRS